MKTETNLEHLLLKLLLLVGLVVLLIWKVASDRNELARLEREADRTQAEWEESYKSLVKQKREAYIQHGITSTR